MDRFFEVQVECYSGYRGEETPLRVRFASGRIEVLQVVDRWLAPDHRYFKIAGDDGATYILRHDIVERRWELTLYDRIGSG